MRSVHTLPLAAMRGGTHAGTETTSAESFPQARASAPPLRILGWSLPTGCLVLMHRDTLCVAHNLGSLGRAACGTGQDGVRNRVDRVLPESVSQVALTLSNTPVV